MPRLIATTTIGCKVNQYETQAVVALLGQTDDFGADAAGQACKDGGPGLVVVNTCCVTSSAAGKSRRAVRRAVRQHPAADILILGCYATSDAQALRRTAMQAGAIGRIHIVGHRDDVASYLRRHVMPADASPAERRPESTRPAGSQKHTETDRPTRQAGEHSNHTLIKAPRRPRVKDDNAGPGTGYLPSIRTFAGHQRAFVKVQDGCDAFCSYCVIPSLRPGPRSRPSAEIVREAAGLVAGGHREIVLCGIFLGAYGRATAIRRKWSGPSALPELLRKVAGIPGLWRVRLSSLEAGDVTDELLEVFAGQPAVAPHLHLPLQSGSAGVLRRMNRQYNPAQFLESLRRARDILDDPAITTDILVGFPGETETDFAATLDVARQAAFSKIHVFPYSPRPGTAAWNRRAEAPSSEVVKTRIKRLAALESELARDYRRRFQGRTVEAVVERPNTKTPPGCARGLTDRYLEAIFPRGQGDDLAGKGDGLAGKIVRLRVVETTGAGLRGELLEISP